ncbi:phosphatidylserine decarboxylase [Sinimarinibacterium sp. CAU 1509]|uniref:archaetidylserine decarboxylase n=1 Tax=Sinimarinibacterium sp. CAU 1509 TaxID=2562283 RepID=UPI0010AC9F19|nr:archaetidylserine decarboxylase [Sinimarinibacterium sp. CAU 1509]TJY62223.1 phosphatidylserine decarboxylase [Sinimarinibacterium sp. CAU 1509]
MNSTEAGERAGLGDQLFAGLQRVLPTRWLSSMVHRVAQIQHPGFKNALIRLFMRGFTIDLTEAERSRVEDYVSFNDFFTRALKPGARPLAADPRAFLSPVDGTVSQFGQIRDGRLIQAKGHSYSLLDLLAGDTERAAAFADGEFCTIYLAPYNYHRIHMPLDGRLQRWTYVPGRLFSVNAATARALPNLFARNERLNAIFDTDAGPVGLIMVGALFVGSLETVWAGMVSPPHLRAEPTEYEPMTPVTLPRGAEIGRFNMGSTVILLAPRQRVQWDTKLQPGQPIRQGQSLGSWTPA